MVDGTYRKAIDKNTLQPLVVKYVNDQNAELAFTPTPAPYCTTEEQPIEVPVTAIQPDNTRITNLPISTIKVGFEFRWYEWNGSQGDWLADLKCKNVWLTDDEVSPDFDRPINCYYTAIQQI